MRVQFRWPVGMPLCRALGDGLWEVRSTLPSKRIARVIYEAGERGILELLDAYRTGILARARQASLDFGVRQAEIELEFVSGWEIP